MKDESRIDAHEFHVGASLPNGPFRRTVNSPLVLLDISAQGIELSVRPPVPRSGFPRTRWTLDEVRRLAPIRGRFSTFGFLLEDTSSAETYVWCLSKVAAAEVLGVMARLGVPIDAHESFIGWWKATVS